MSDVHNVSSIIQYNTCSGIFQIYLGDRWNSNPHCTRPQPVALPVCHYHSSPAPNRTEIIGAKSQCNKPLYDKRILRALIGTRVQFSALQVRHITIYALRAVVVKIGNDPISLVFQTSANPFQLLYRIEGRTRIELVFLSFADLCPYHH